MSTKVRLIVVAVFALAALIGVASWFGVQQARERDRLDKAVQAAHRAADAGAAGKPLCERAVAVIEPLLSGSDFDDDKAVAGYRALGECQMLLERYEAAAKAFSAVVQRAPQQSRAHGELARALSKLGRHAEAVRSAQLSVQLAPQAWQAHRALGIALSAAGRKDEAIAALQKAKSMAPAAEQAAADRAIARLKDELTPASLETKP